MLITLSNKAEIMLKITKTSEQIEAEIILSIIYFSH